MHVACLGPTSSFHFCRWVHALTEAGLQVTVLTAHAQEALPLNAVKVIHLKYLAPWGYAMNAPALRQTLKSLRPDLLHAHGASGYGLLAHLCRFQPLVLSVWGSDVCEFPHRTWIHKRVLMANLKSAKTICATSAFLRKKTHDWNPKAAVTVTPFGVSQDFFQDSSKPQTDFFHVGTVRGMEECYGIDLLLKAFAALRAQTPDKPMHLTLVGGGTQAGTYQRLARELGLAHTVDFLGPLPPKDLIPVLKTFDVFVAPSRYEGFGVAVLEAAALGIPSIVSDAGALPEIVENESTGLVVPSENPGALAEALQTLHDNPSLRKQLGQAARQRTLEKYTWPACTHQMISAYQNALRGHDA